MKCNASGSLLCEKCLLDTPNASPTEHSFIHAVFDYRNPTIKNAIWRFKYRNSRSIAKCFSKQLYEDIIAEVGEDVDAHIREKFLLVPIPLHATRKRERGYNQSELLAQALLACDTASIFEFAPNILSRARNTTPQARSEKRSARIKNLQGAFTAHDHARIRGRSIILIDDVTTTGATLLAAKQALSPAKPRKVLAFTITH